MFTRSITRVTLVFIIFCVSLLLITSFTTTAVIARPRADLIVNPGESIQAAIDAANDGDTIIVNAGDYTESLTLSKPVSLTGVNSDTTIIHAMPGQRVLTVTGATISNSVVISGLTFTGGDVTGGVNCPAYCGGGISILDNALPLLHSLNVISNTAYGGGGIYATGNATIVSTRIEGNHSSAYAAGVEIEDTATISGAQFINNSGGTAGGLQVRYVAMITNTLFSSNTATYASSIGAADGAGGAAICFANSFECASQIFNSRFEGNSSAVSALVGVDLFVTNTLFMSNTSSCQRTPCAGAALATWRLTFVDSRVEGNLADQSAYGSNASGGIWVSGPAFVTNSDFISNTGTTSYGAGGLRGGDVWLKGGHFERNTNRSVGGAVYAVHAYVQDTQFRDNTGQSAGAIFAWCCVDINNALFENNHAQGGDGGGALMVNGAVNITDTRFISNSSGTSGGAIVIAAFDVAAITNTLFARNTATNGGTAISVWGVPSNWPSRDIYLNHVTIADPNLNPSSAIDIPYSALYMTNTIIANHAVGIDTISGTVTEDYNLFYGNLTNTVGVMIGTHSLIGDPRFVDPGHADYHLAFGSAAIDRGVNAGVYTDLDGNPRPIGSGFDIGAYEFASGTRYVATTGDDASNLCLDQLSPCATIQHAIDVAADGEQVLIASGLYTQSATLNKPVSLTGVNSDTTIIHAMPGQRVLTVTGSSITTSVVIAGLTFTGGDVPGGGPCPAACGGGLYADSDVTLINMQFANNLAGSSGGGVYASSPTTVTISGSRFTSNTALYQGGAIYAGGVVNVIDSRFDGNTAYQGGGGLFAVQSTLNQVDFSGNQTVYDYNVSSSGGAGAYLINGKVLNSRFENNVAAASGGGLAVNNEVSVINTNFISNYASLDGGGLFAFSAIIDSSRFDRNQSFRAGGGLNVAIASISDSLFISNTAQHEGGAGAYSDRMARLYHSRFENNQCLNSCAGGGLFVRRPVWPDQPLGIEQTLFINNFSLLGGGAYVDGVDGAFTLSDSQFISNTAVVAGGGLVLGNNHYTRIANTIFARNTSQLDNAADLIFYQNGSTNLTNVTIADVTLNPHIAISSETTQLSVTNTTIANHAIGIGNNGGTVTEDYNLFYGNFTNTVGVENGEHSLSGDPHFVDPAHDDYHLAADSAAIDHGTDAGVYTDLDGNVRPHGADFDIGAYEFIHDLRYVATTGVDTNNVCLDQLSPCATVQHAIDVAQDGEQVLIASGLYTQSATLSKPVSLTGVNSDTTILHAVAGQRVLTVTGSTINNSVVISGLTFMGGYADYGGGLLVQGSSTPLIQHVIISNNIASYIGGGMYAAAGSPLTLRNVIVSHNQGFFMAGMSVEDQLILDKSLIADNQGPGVNAPGGAIVNASRFERNSQGLTSWGAVDVTDSWFENNQGSGLACGRLALTDTEFIDNVSTGNGAAVNAESATIVGGRFERNHSTNIAGALYIHFDLVMSGTILTNNTASGYGGAIVASTITIQHSRFEQNQSLYGNAGALYALSAIISDSEFIDNVASADGGAIYIEYDARLTEARLIGNRCTAATCRGGAVFVQSPLTLLDSWLMHNSAGGVGGGLYLGYGQGVLINNVVANNQAATSGGGIYIAGNRARLVHNTLVNNASGDGTSVTVTNNDDWWTHTNYLSTVELTNTLLSDQPIGLQVTQNNTATLYNTLWYNTPVTVSQSPLATISAFSDVYGDPHFVDPAQDDYHLAANSAAIDHGIDAGVYTDLDGNLRPIGNGFDIGAYEYQGGTRYVATTGDDTSNGCLDQLAPCATVQHAIDVANDGEQVLIASGLYTQSTTLSKPVSLTGVNSDTTIIHATAGQRVLTVTGATISNSVVISGLTFTGGYADFGGGVYSDAPLVVVNSEFISNTAQQSGGGAVLLATSIVSDVYLQQNYCLDDGCTGGGLQLGGLVTPTMQFEIRQSRFISNGADYGGGFNATGVVTISDSAFTGNGAYAGGGGEVHGSAHVLNSRFDSNFGSGFGSMGGGLYISGETVISQTVFQNNWAMNTGGGLRTKGSATVFDSQFIANRSSNSAGGGLSAVNAITLEQTDFFSNTAFGPGGGVIAFGPAALLNGRFENNMCLSVGCFGGGLDAIRDLAITGTQFISNSATYWGGALYREQLGDSRIVNAVFARNHSTLGGAAIYLKAAGDTVILHTTVADVSSNPTSAVAVIAGTVTLTNTIIANHAIGINTITGTVTEDYNLFYGNLTNTVGVITGEHSFVGDPRFVVPAHDDYHLAVGSAAIDHGVDAGVYTDLDGNPRPIGSGFDIGAYEYQGLIYRAYLPVLRQ